MFKFYLDAWLFCYHNGVPLTCIKRISMREWTVTAQMTTRPEGA